MRKLAFFLLVIASACNKQGGIRITGDVKGIRDGVIYLYDPFQVTSKIIDSAEVKNGRFAFTLDPSVGFEPFLVSIWYYDTTSFPSRKVLAFNCAHRGLDGKKYASAGGFMIERGLTSISGSVVGYSWAKGYFGDVQISGGSQTFSYLQNSEFITLDQNASPGVFDRNRAIIRKYPYSYFLIESLYRSREAFTNTQIQAYLELFSPDVRRSAWGVRLGQFAKGRYELPGIDTIIRKAAPVGAGRSTDPR
jgi:hypothetical protein